MGVTSAIEWTNATYNPWRGCDKVSPGCAHCYMFTEQRRYGRDPSVVVRCADSTFYAPLRSSKWRKLPEGALVFTCSWSDWFHEDADAWRDDAWAVLRERPDLTWQVLTKRPERIADHLPDDWGDGWPNVWLGVSIENRRYVERADVLRSVPAVCRFISAEPLLGPLLSPYVGAGWVDWGDGYDGYELNLQGIDWLILGGESGPKPRPMQLDWVRALRDAALAMACDSCHGSGVERGDLCSLCKGGSTRPALFLKQLGGHPDKRGGDQAVLDGRRWTELPNLARRLAFR